MSEARTVSGESEGAGGTSLPPTAPRRLVASSDVLTALAWEQLSGGVATVDEMLILTTGKGGAEQEYVATVADVRVPFDAATDLEAVTFDHMDITRGRVVAGVTALWLRPDPLARLAAAEVFELRGGAEAPPRSSARLCVLCITSDGEEVPVKKKLLRPCITLTAQVLEDRGRYRDAFETARDAGALEGEFLFIYRYIFIRILLTI